MDGQAYFPAPSVLWKVWSSIFSACTIHGWSLDQPLNVVFLARAVADDEIPPPILYAVIDRVRAIDGVAEQDYALIDVAACIYWTGIVRLQAGPDRTTLAINDFLSDWRDHLPESWRGHATLDTLKGSYIQPSKNAIAFGESEPTIADSAPSTAPTKATGSQARKWHEKFKHSRK
ncbi:MAG: hypothetical protein LQ345_001608 [Seirophora villosa]|nr:MAG: hypothetical protein LQ345_001608 [Seirophora villosa]